MPSTAALGFVADQPLATAGLLDWPFADTATGTIKAVVAATTTKRFPLIAGRRRQFRAATGVAAHMPLFGFGEFDHFVISK